MENNCISTKNFKVKGKEYFITLVIEDGEFAVDKIICKTGNEPNAAGIIVPHKNVE